jgi:acetyl-CoA carboxylase biotin carboxyl carrier protein
MGKARDGRVFQPVIEAIEHRVDDFIDLLCPRVGRWRGGPQPGDLVGPGEDLGELEILGELHRLVAPKGVSGAVVEDPDRRAHAPLPVDYKARLVRLDPEATPAAAVAAEAESEAATGLVFRAPLSGRFYGRPTPSQPPFCRRGDTVKTGQTVALLEVMKTFNRVVFGGPDMPAEAKVKRVVPDDESDLDEGDAILELEPLP